MFDSSHIFVFNEDRVMSTAASVSLECQSCRSDLEYVESEHERRQTNKMCTKQTRL